MNMSVPLVTLGKFNFGLICDPQNQKPQFIPPLLTDRRTDKSAKLKIPQLYVCTRRHTLIIIILKSIGRTYLSLLSLSLGECPLSVTLHADSSQFDDTLSKRYQPQNVSKCLHNMQNTAHITFTKLGFKT